MVSIFEKSKHLCPVEKQAGESVCVADATTRSSHQPAMPTVKPFFGVLDFEKLCVNYGA